MVPDVGSSEVSSTSCALCGTTVTDIPVTWMFESDPRRGGVWYCERCARENLRAIESKLDQAWW
jgi:transposase